MSLVKLVNINKEFNVGKKEKCSVLQNINLEIEEGEIVAVYGPSGSGKTTLLHIMGLIEPPTSGEIFIDNENIGILSAKKRALIRRNYIGFVFQFYHLIPELNVLDNVLLPARFKNNSFSWFKNKKEIKEKAIELLKRVGLINKLKNRPTTLSGGEKQRVAVIRAIINNPKILLCDEPTGSLDAENGEIVINLLKEINSCYNISIVIATHETNIAKISGKVLNLPYYKESR